jgi:hypothetical protein
LSSRAPCCGEVLYQAAEDDVGDSTLEAADGLEVGLAGGALAQVVVAAGSGHAGLGDGRDVQDVVEPAVAATVESVPVVVAGGHVDRCGACVAGEVSLGWKPADVDDLSDGLAGAELADSGDLDQ